MPTSKVMSESHIPAQAGSTVEICPFTGSSKQGAALLAELSEKHAVLVGLEHEVAFGDAIAIRFWDGDLAAYQVSARVSDPNPTVERTEVLLLGTWKTVELRRGQRIPMPRLSLVAEAREDEGKITRRFQLVAADLSGVGCGVTGVGPPPAVGSMLYLRAGDDEGAPWVARRGQARCRRAGSAHGAPGSSSSRRTTRSATGCSHGATPRQTPHAPPEALPTPRRGRACAPRRSCAAPTRRRSA